MAENDSIRQRIISSVFTKLNASGHQETYAAHVKIWEDVPPEEGGKKPRYILLSRSSDGSGYIHKSKLNSNGSFSVGKTWKLNELRAVEVVNPLAFNVTLARTYKWQTEDERAQAALVVSLIRLFRSVTGGSHLQIIGLKDPDDPTPQTPRQPIVPSTYTRMERAPTPPNGVPLLPATPRRPYESSKSEMSQSRISEVSSQYNVPVSASASAPRTPSRSRRPPSPDARPRSNDVAPVQSSTEISASPRVLPGTLPIPPHSSVPSSLRPGGVRRPIASNTPSSTSINSPQTPDHSVPAPSTLLQQSNASTHAYSTSVPTPVPISTMRQNGSSRPSAPPSLRLETTANTDATYSSARIPLTSSVETRTVADLVSQPHQSSTPEQHPRQYKESDAMPSSSQARREQNNRVSFFDPANQAVLDRLLYGDFMLKNEWDDDDRVGEVAEETAQAMLTSVEEMLEGYEWASGSGVGTVHGSTAQIEARLLDELVALDKANIHSFIESDDRVNIVLKYLDDTITDLDGMDSILSSYKIHLNAVSDDITYIQSQDRGLQVQTQNQRALLTEIEELLKTVHVDREALLTLTQASLEKGIDVLESAASQLYQALQAGRDRDMAATMERLEEYRAYNAQFCKRLYDFLSIMCTAQAKLLLGDSNGVTISSRGKPSFQDHKAMETYLGRYSGLMLYLKEMDEQTYGRLCAAYFSSASDLHSTQIKSFLSICNNMIKKRDEESEGFGMSTPGTGSRAVAGVRRAGTIVKSPLESRREKKDAGDGRLDASDVFGLILEGVAPLVYSEEDFIADFLQINDAALTFADYMSLESYFKRQASRAAGLSSSTLKLVRGALDLIFGFLPAELKTWMDGALAKDPLQIVGMLAGIEKFLIDAEERNRMFFSNLLDRQHIRMKGLYERRVNDHIKSVEDTKLTSKKRNGVASFIKYFPTYVGRLEVQLIGADTLGIRQTVDASYDRIVEAMFAALKQMAKMDGEGEDKGQLNYHVILVENMHHFVAEISQLGIGPVASFLHKAQSIYDENLNAYVKLILRRPFAKIIDYFEGVDRLLKTTAPSEVSSNSSYSKSALKKVIKEYTSKDIRKLIDSLFKRVEKHFTEASEKATTEEVSSSTGIAPGTVLVGVWKACEEELLRMTEFFVKRISQCYGTTGIDLEYTTADVESAFKRHRLVS